MDNGHSAKWCPARQCAKQKNGHPGLSRKIFCSAIEGDIKSINIDWVMCGTNLESIRPSSGFRAGSIQDKSKRGPNLGGWGWR